MKNLVAVNWLNENLSDERIVILDARQKQNKAGLASENNEVQIPNARFFDLDNVFSIQGIDLPNMLPTAEEFQTHTRKLGINASSKIIVYDNLGVYASPRVWWMFKAMGHSEVAVLDGGLPEWIKNDFPTEAIQENKVTAGDFVATFNQNTVRNAEQILENITSGNETVIDARSKERFEGIAPEPRAGLRSGSIPNSFNLPFQEVLHNGKYKSKEELVKIFSQFKVEDKPKVFSCGSGLTACILLLANELVDDSPKAIYDGSWTEWAQLHKA